MRKVLYIGSDRVTTQTFRRTDNAYCMKLNEEHVKRRLEELFTLHLTESGIELEKRPLLATHLAMIAVGELRKSYTT